MDTTARLKEIIRENSNNIAFIIGNGINRRFFRDKVLLWDELIKKLSYGFLSDGSSTPDISLTELFDLIELDATSDHGIINEFVEYTKTNKVDSHTALSRSKSVHFEEIQRMVNRPTNNVNPISYESFKKMYLEYLKGCRKWCMNNRDDGESLTDSQCVEYFMDYAKNPNKIRVMKNIVKNTVAQEYTLNLRDSDLTKLIIFFKYLGTPVLTTNYDSILSQSLNLFKYKMGKSFTAFYPWNTYYSDKELEYPTSNFGIWHINGIVEYPQSIKLGISDYMGNVERARKMLQSHDFNEFFNGKNQNNWAGYNTWLHIFFNKNLFIFGLKLETDEVFIRWLLIQRAKYSQMYNKNLGGWFIDKGISDGNKFFLRKVGFNIIEIQNFDELYNSFK